MEKLFTQAVFSVAERTYSWADVVLAAKLWDEWDAVETRTLVGVACLSHAGRSGTMLDERDVEAAATEFRYEHDLISGDEMKAWLARWGLTAKEWKEYVRWTLLRDGPSAPSAEVLDRESIAADLVSSRIWVEAICSGDLARFARALAGRAAVAARVRQEAYAVGAGTATWDASFTMCVDLDPDDWPGLSRGALRDKIENLALVERRYEAELPDILTATAVAEQIRLHYFDWIRFDCEATTFPTQDMAKEVALGVREDGMAFDEVAAEVGTPVRRSAWYRDAIEPALQTALVAASPGELVGPLFVDDLYVLIRLREKIVPSADDPETARRAETAALDAALTREINDRVRWHTRI